MLQSNSVLASKVRLLWNNFWSGGISNPLAAIEQINYLLFMKRMDELDLKNKADAEFTKEKYISKFAGTYTHPDSRNVKNEKDKLKIEKEKLRWSYIKHMPSEERLAHVNRWVFPFLKDLNGEESNFTHHMKNAVFIISKPSLLTEAMNIIDEIFVEIERDANEGGQAFQDIQGDVYEMLLSEIASAGKNGQFRTPRHIIKLVSELIGPKLGDKICDPACGSGGFLLGAYQYIVTQLDKGKENKKLDEDGFVRNSVSGVMTEKVKTILNDSLYGYDIDTTMVRLGLMNLMMHGLDNPNIDYKDTLSKSFEEQGMYNVVLANPPFTGSIDKGDINENLKLGTTKTELLFIEKIFNLLKMGGTAGVIIPQGVLFGTANAFVDARKLLIENSELKAVISLPSGVFKPYAGVSTAILLFTKGSETKNVWFYDMESDGYSLDDKRVKLEGYGDLQDIVSKFKCRDPKKDIDREQKHFYVPKQEIVDEKYDLSFSKYKKDIHEEVHYDDPKVILEKLISLEIGDLDMTSFKNVNGGLLKEILELQEILK